MFETYAAYTNAVSLLVGDEGDWLNWFAWENDFGKKELQVGFSDGHKLAVKAVEDLLFVIKHA
jgi:hypothetical protein